MSASSQSTSSRGRLIRPNPRYSDSVNSVPATQDMSEDPMQNSNQNSEVVCGDTTGMPSEEMPWDTQFGATQAEGEANGKGIQEADVLTVTDITTITAQLDELSQTVAVNQELIVKKISIQEAELKQAIAKEVREQIAKIKQSVALEIKDQIKPILEATKAIREEIKEKEHQERSTQERIQQLEQENAELKEKLKQATATTPTNGNGTTPEEATKKTYAIKFSEDQNPILSSFYPCTIFLNTEKFASAEAAYQVQKLYYNSEDLDEEAKYSIKQNIMEAHDPVDVKTLGDDSIPSSCKWDTAKFNVMEKIQEAKFQQISEFREELLRTKGCELTHPVADEEWRTAFPKILNNIRDKQETGGNPGYWETQILPSTRGIIIGDSVFSHINPNEIAPKTWKSKCATAEDLQKFTQELPENPGLHFVIVGVGINNIRKGDDPEQVGQLIADSLTELQRKAPNATIIFSAAICRPTAADFPKVSALNDKIRALCERRFITFIMFITHTRLMTQPHQLRDDYHPNPEGGTRLLAYALKVSLPNGRHRSLSRDGRRTRIEHDTDKQRFSNAARGRGGQGQRGKLFRNRRDHYNNNMY